MTEEHFESAKQSLLSHIQGLFEEIEQETVMSHQEKYALLEDACAGASDIDELRVAFEQWHGEHAEDIGLEHEAHEIWDHALGGEEGYTAGLPDEKILVVEDEVEAEKDMDRSEEY